MDVYQEFNNTKMLLNLTLMFTEEEHNCLWRDCGFCSVDGDGELLRHLFFHCYHTKLKQWGLAILKGHSDMGSCSVGVHNRNIVPEVQENFLCIWEHCEVRFIKLSSICSVCQTHSRLYLGKRRLMSVFVFRCLWIIQSGSTDM